MNENGPFEAFDNSKPFKMTKRPGPGKGMIHGSGADWAAPEGTPIPKEWTPKGYNRPASSINEPFFITEIPEMTPLESIKIGNGFLPDEGETEPAPGYWERAMKDAEKITVKMLQETAEGMMNDIINKREVDRIRQNAKICDLEIEIMNLPKKKVKKDDVYKLVHRAYRIGKGEF